MSANGFYADREQLKRNVLGHVVTDTPVAIRLRYIGTGTVTSVIVTTATDITMITSDGGTDEYLFSAYTTIGALADAINAAGIFEAKVLDSLRSGASANRLFAETITATTHIEGYRIWDVQLDTSTALQFAWCLDPAERGFFKTAKAKSHRVNLNAIVYAINMGTAAVDSVQLWERNGTIETQLQGWLSVDTTETTIGSTTSSNALYNATEGNELVVLVKDGATLADASGNFLDVYGSIE